MPHNNNDEIDLGLLYGKLKQSFKKGIGVGFKGIDFIQKKWLILVILLVVGIVLGFLSDKQQQQQQEAKLLLRVNFDAVNYVYSEVEVFDKKVKSRDTIFLEKVGLNPDSSEVIGLELKPIINLKDIIKNLDENDRKLEGLVKNLDFDNDDDEEIKIYETFTSDYKHHILHLDLSHNATEETLNKVISFINNNEFLEELKTTRIKNIEEHIVYNNKMISQIDQSLDAYHANKSISSPSDQIYIVDKNFSISNLFKTKIELEKEQKELKEELVYAKDIVVMINKPNLSNVENGILGNKIIFYPIMLVFIFLFLAWMKHLYFYFKKIAENT